MRAHFVRGKDPKDAMNIGDSYTRIHNAILNAIKEIILIHNLDPDCIRDYSNKSEESGELYDIDIRINQMQFQYSIQYSSALEHFSIGYGVINNRHQHSNGLVNTNIYDLETAKRKIISWIEANKRITNESHFERGLDPKKAMSIGDKEAQYQKYLDDWENYYDHARRLINNTKTINELLDVFVDWDNKEPGLDKQKIAIDYSRKHLQKYFNQQFKGNLVKAKKWCIDYINKQEPNIMDY